MRRRHLLKSIPGAVLALPALAGCQWHAGPLRIGANLWPGYASLRLAELSGGLDVELARVLDFPNSSMVLTAFRNGLIDAAALTLDEVLLLAANGQALRIVLVFDFSNGADVIIARAGLNSLADLQGRRIGVETEALGAYLVGRALDRVGLGLDRVEIVSLPLDHHETAFVAAEVDALVTFEPVRSRLLARGGRQLFSSAEIPGEIVDVLIVREGLLQERRRDLQSVVAAHFAGRAKALADPVAAAHLLGARAGAEPDDFGVALSLMHLPDAAENRRLLGDGPDSLVAALIRMQHAMLARGLIGAPLDPAGLLDPNLVRRS